ncbi:hypothetical protein GF336_00690 [Candidatus Woesearchaeota archaeon]|nr:hypothetical protein [Candidatus Woesearchaeota archaeon]
MVKKQTKSTLGYFHSRKNRKEDGIQPKKLQSRFQKLTEKQKIIVMSLLMDIPRWKAAQFRLILEI